MKTLASWLLMLVAVCISIILSILIMINGWGMQPKSWIWILGVSILGQIVVQLFVEVSKKL